VNEDSRIVNVYRQDDHQTSLLNFYRRVINLRKRERALYQGDWIPVEAGRDILAYYREDGDSCFFIALNFSGTERRCKANNASHFEIAISTDRMPNARMSIKDFVLNPYEVLIAKRIN
jgi:glycosidase